VQLHTLLHKPSPYLHHFLDFNRLYFKLSPISTPLSWISTGYISSRALIYTISWISTGFISSRAFGFKQAEPLTSILPAGLQAEPSKPLPDFQPTDLQPAGFQAEPFPLLDFRASLLTDFHMTQLRAETRDPKILLTETGSSFIAPPPDIQVEPLSDERCRVGGSGFSHDEVDTGGETIPPLRVILMGVVLRFFRLLARALIKHLH
jgi:hypothetical protein